MEVHIVKDVLFTGMVTSCLIQLVFNSSVATHFVTDVLFTDIYTVQHVLVSGCSNTSNINIAHNLYKNMKY